MQQKYPGRRANAADGRSGRLITIGLPLPHEGVGNALRATFRASRNDIPIDMLELLAKLDRH